MQGLCWLRKWALAMAQVSTSKLLGMLIEYFLGHANLQMRSVVQVQI